MGVFETDEACRVWKEEYELEFPVVADDEVGTLFRTYTNGWVPWSVLVGPDQKIVFSENEFDEVGFSNAILEMYEQPSAQDTVARAPRRTGPARVVILGGGTGGLVAANDLRSRLDGGHEIVVIDRSADHVYQPSQLWQIVGQRKQGQFRRPLSRLTKKGIEFRREEVEGIEPDRKVVRAGSDELQYDYLIVSLGAQLAPQTVAGFTKAAYNLYDPDDCDRIFAALERFDGGTVGILVTSLPFKCPAAPYEAAFLIESFVRKRGIRRKVDIHLFTPEHTPMPVTPASLGDGIADMLSARGIHYHPLFTFNELRPDTREVVSSDAVSEPIDLLIGIPPHESPEVVRKSPLLGVSGFIHVDSETLRTGHDGVFAIGDVTTIKLPNGKALPKAGVFAHSEAKVVVEQIAAELKGDEPSASFAGKGYCWIELGDGRAGFAGGNFYVGPEPQIKMRRPGRALHWGKVAFEKWWLRHWF